MPKGKVEAHPEVGNQQELWLRNIQDWTGIGMTDKLFGLAENMKECD